VLMVHGAGTTVGFAAVQLALMRGARVVATAGDTYARQLREFGATVTAYGDGMVERVRDIVGGSPDLVLDTAPPTGVLPELIRIAGGDPRRVLTVTDFAAAAALGLRDSFGEGTPLRYDMLAEFARWAAEGRLAVPIARTFALEDWDLARAISQGGQARGKLVLLPGGLAAAD
jgi:NADPH:quinone reductase-like Zn-dependent oxidoreductase